MNFNNGVNIVKKIILISAKKLEKRWYRGLKDSSFSLVSLFFVFRERKCYYGRKVRKKSKIMELKN